MIIDLFRISIYYKNGKNIYKKYLYQSGKIYIQFENNYANTCQIVGGELNNFWGMVDDLIRLQKLVKIFEGNSFDIYKYDGYYFSNVNYQELIKISREKKLNQLEE